VALSTTTRRGMVWPRQSVKCKASSPSFIALLRVEHDGFPGRDEQADSGLRVGQGPWLPRSVAQKNHLGWRRDRDR
jgi:hypothetical protein